MGGAAAGEVASQIAVETIAAALGGAVGRRRPSAGEHAFLPRTVRLGRGGRGGQSRHHRQARRTTSEHAGMGTTMVGVWLDHDIASLAHVGDSRAYLRHDAGSSR